MPPIALRAIQRSKTFEQVVHAVLELRDEFASLRGCQREIEERLRDGKMSPREALELQIAWRERWERLVGKLESPGRMAIAQTSIPLFNESIRIVKSVTSSDVIDVVAATIGWIGPGVEALGALQMRPIHRSVSNYLSTSDQELLRAVARIFETDFVRLDDDMRALAYQQGNPWRLALDQTSLPLHTAPAINRANMIPRSPYGAQQTSTIRPDAYGVGQFPSQPPERHEASLYRGRYRPATERS